MISVEEATATMLSEPRRILVFSARRRNDAHKVMRNIAAELVKTISLSNPSLDNLQILDSSKDLSPWEDTLPPISEVHPTSDLSEMMLHRSDCIVMFGRGVFAHPSITPVLASTRFYAALLYTWDTPKLIERVHSFQKAVYLS